MFGLISKKKVAKSENKTVEHFQKENQRLRILVESLKTDSHFVKGLIHQTGDLIHYQDHDYTQQGHSTAGTVFNQIGTILRRLADEPERHKISVSSLLKESRSLKHTIQKESLPGFLEEIKDFTAVHLIDMVSRMQGQSNVDDWREAAKTIKHLSGLKKPKIE